MESPNLSNDLSAHRIVMTKMMIYMTLKFTDDSDSRLWFLELACASAFPLRLLRRGLFESMLHRRWHGLSQAEMISQLLILCKDSLIEFGVSEFKSGREFRKLADPVTESDLAELLNRSKHDFIFFRMTTKGADEFAKTTTPNWDIYVRYNVESYCEQTNEIHVVLEGKSPKPFFNLDAKASRFRWHKEVDFFSFHVVEDWQALYWKNFKTGVRVKIVTNTSITDDLTQIINLNWREIGYDRFECAKVLGNS